MRAARSTRKSVLLLLAITAGSSPLAGQAAVRRPTYSILTRAAPGPLQAGILEEPRDSAQRDIRPAHWKEGALIGGLVGIAAGALLGAAICRNSEQSDRNCSGSTVGGGLIVGLVLAIPGALIGGQIPKGAAPE